ncbi:FAD-dependent oxidoreductase [Saccharomonospora sp. NPDC006951]
MAHTTDVLVIGAGGSGMSAAISAATSGASVVVLEKCARPGGSTAMSVGSFTAARTSYQYRAGVNDAVELFVADMAKANGTREGLENTALRELLAENAGPTLEWLSSIGVQFLGPTPEPPYEKPRMHNVVPNSRAYASALLRECARRGVEVRTGARVDALLRNAGGEVIGARVRGTDYIGRKAVVLATGDYSADPEFKATYAGASAALVPPVNPGSTGDGFRLGSDVGAVLVQMERLYEGLRFHPSRRPDPIKLLPAHPAVSQLLRRGAERFPRLLAFVARGALTSWVAPNNTMYRAGGVLVGASGRRIANEDSDSAMARAVASEKDNRAYLIFDETVASRFSAWPNPVSTFPGVAYAYVDDYRRYRPDLHHRASDIGELAAKIGVPAETLRATVTTWNAAADSGTDSEFGREHLGEGLLRAPYYALGPLGAFVTLTDGGLAVDSRLRVTDAEEKPIPGLYAAGSTGQGGLQLLNHGLHIGWAMTSGRIAGRNAAHEEMRSDLAPVRPSERTAPG